MKTLKKIGIAIVVIAVLAVAAFLILRKSEKPQMKYKTAEIHRGSIVNTVTATGTIEPIVQVRRYRASSIIFMWITTRW